MSIVRRKMSHDNVVCDKIILWLLQISLDGTLKVCYDVVGLILRPLHFMLWRLWFWLVLAHLLPHFCVIALEARRTLIPK